MNQVTNLIQWKNLSKEEQAGFDFENYEYEWQSETIWEPVNWEPLKPNPNGVYRLVIEPEKFYMMSHKDHIEQFCLRGADVTSVDEMIISIRPATEAEIPEPETKPATLEDRVKAEYPDYDVVMLRFMREGDECYDLLKMDSDKYTYGEFHEEHVAAQSMRFFHEYVYFDGSEFYTYKRPTDELADKTITPIAALFVRGEG